MKPFLFFMAVIGICASVFAQDQGNVPSQPNTVQYYSGKFGFYNPGEGLNNGLFFGVDGITEFTHYNFTISGAIDLYPKQSINMFHNPQPDITQQQILLLPLHLNVGYRVLDIGNADTRGYFGVGGGYYFYFYTLDYRSSSGGILGGLTTKSESKNGGNIFGSIFGRVLVGKVFIESRYFLASKEDETIDGHSYTVDPSGFSIMLGFQH